MSGPVLRSSSGVYADSLVAVKESVEEWLRKARKAGHADLSDEQIASVARVATLASSPVLTSLYRAGVQSGRVAFALAHGLPPPDGPESCHCPACGKLLTAL